MTVPVGGRWEGGPMRNAAHRRQDEAIPVPSPRDLAAEAAALLDRAEALLPLLEAGRADVRAVDETVFLGRALGDLTAALEDAAAGEAVIQAVDRAAYARGWDARGAAGQQPSRPRHAGRGRHLRGLPSIPATAARAAAAGIVAAGLTAGGIAAGMHDESSVRAVAAGPARHAALHRMAPDRATVVPQPRWSPPPRPSMAAATARPAPVAVPTQAVPASSPPPPAPVPSVTAAPPPVLDVPRFLDLGDSILGQLQLSATGPEAVAWTATATDGVVLSSYAGVVVPGEPATLDVTDRPANGGWIYISVGRATYPVKVTSALGPVLALPSGL